MSKASNRRSTAISTCNDDTAGYKNGHSDPVTNLILDIDGLYTGTPPSGAARGLDGSVNFADPLSISSDSVWLEVATNATIYDANGSAQIATAGNTLGLENFFEPRVPSSSASELVSAALLSLGISVLILRKRR